MTNYRTPRGKSAIATSTGATVPTGETGAESGRLSVMRAWVGVDSGSSLVGGISLSSPSRVGDLGVQSDLRTIVGVIVGMLDG